MLQLVIYMLNNIILLHFSMEAGRDRLEFLDLSASKASNANTVVSGDGGTATMDHLAR